MTSAVPCLIYLSSILLVCNVVNGANILVVFPLAGGSHYILGSGVTRVLVEAGHDVTLISAFEQKDPPKNGGKWTDVVLTGFVEQLERLFGNKSFFDMGSMPVIMNLPFLSQMGIDMTRNVLEHPNVQKLIKSNQKFDAVIVEQFNNDALKGFSWHFKAPLIILSSMGANQWVNPLVGNPGPPSYIPDILLSYSDHMTFCERVKNTLFTIAAELTRHLYFFPRQNDLLQEFFPNPPPHLDDVLYNASIVLLNSHVSTNQPKPHVPAMIEVGGYHIKPPKKLPKDLQDFLDGAKEGVVYFSMGSNLKSSTMPVERKDTIVKALSKLKQKVLWKWEEDTLPGKPANVHTGKWLPQSDILAHPNVKLFITHGGLLSTTETIYHGKPILALPIFGDQRMNSAASVNAGYALTLNFDTMTEEELLNTLNELLNNQKYYKNAQRRSKIMHDRVQTPQQAVVYWTEYVIRHQGATHLRVSALDLSWYQYLLLDVFAFLIVSSIATIIGLVLICKQIYKCISKQKEQTKKVKKN